MKGSYNYDVTVMPSAKRDIRHIDRSAIPRIFEAIQSLEGDPFPPGHIKVKGRRGLVRIRIGEYRVIYMVDTALKQVLVYHIHLRDETTYKKLLLL
jgi:mRNA interferase RelE/StbE